MSWVGCDELRQLLPRCERGDLIALQLHAQRLTFELQLNRGIIADAKHSGERSAVLACGHPHGGALSELGEQSRTPLSLGSLSGSPPAPPTPSSGI